MGASDISVEADQFYFAFSGMLDDILEGVDEAVMPAVQAGCRASRDTARTMANELFKPQNGKHLYGPSISYKTKRKKKLEAWGEVGSKEYPGLPHLLELGHASIGGSRFVQGRHHWSDAYKDGAKAFERKLSQGVDAALG